MADRTLEVQLKLTHQQFAAEARRVQQETEQLGSRIKQISAETNRAIAEDAKLSARIAIEHAKNVAQEMERWRKGAEILDRTPQAIAGMGMAIGATLVRGVNAYLQAAGRSEALSRQWLARLLPYTRIFAALDADKAGTLNATRLAALSARVTPVRIPEGNDVTEYHQTGGDVRAWVMTVALFSSNRW